MMPVIELIGLTKRFGASHALQGADIAIQPGQIVGLLGPNASGKTTLLKIAAGLLTETSGKIHYYNNAQPGPEARGTISFCPDSLDFPKWMKVCDAFNFYRDMYPDYMETRADEIISILGLENFYKTHVSRLSKGMKERLVMGLTFSRKTHLYLLDEPMDGIDPVGKSKVVDAILSMRPDDGSVLISTHMVKDIERILDAVYFLSNGRTIFSGDCEDIHENQSKTVEQAYLEVFSNENPV